MHPPSGPLAFDNSPIDGLLPLKVMVPVPQSTGRELPVVVTTMEVTSVLCGTVTLSSEATL